MPFQPRKRGFSAVGNSSGSDATESASKRPRTSGAAFALRRAAPRCALCSTPLPKGAAAGGVCAACEHTRARDIAAERQAETERHAALAKERANVWQTCQTCMIDGKTDVGGDRKLADGPCASGAPPLPPDIEDLSASIGCESTNCKVLWTRLRNDRLFSGHGK